MSYKDTLLAVQAMERMRAPKESLREFIKRLGDQPNDAPKVCPHCGNEVHAPSFGAHVIWCAKRIERETKRPA